MKYQAKRQPDTAEILTWEETRRDVMSQPEAEVEKERRGTDGFDIH